MTERTKILLLALAFLVPAAATRFAKLDWGFSGDETTEFTSIRTLFEEPFFEREMNSSNRGPRAHPVAYLIQAAAHRVFGKSEAGARTGVAAAGTLAIVLAVALIYHIYGLPTAVIAGILLILAPWHLSHSQTNRNYSYAFLFASLAMLMAMIAWRDNSFRWAAAAAVCSALAVASHNLTLVIPLALAGYTVVSRFLFKDPWPGRAVKGYAAFGVPLLSVTLVLMVIAMRGWGEIGSGYSSAHTLAALASNMVWGIALLAGVGWVWVWRDRRPEDMILAAIVLTAMLEAAIVPSLASFRHDYVFPVSLAFILLASRALAAVYAYLKPHSRLLGAGIVIAAVLLPIPSFVSHYADGNKKDYRGAARYISQHWRDGDIVAADSNGLLAFYLKRDVLPVRRPGFSGKQCIEELQKLRSSGKRVWFVCRYAREEPDTGVDQWMWRNAVRHLRLKRQRIDFYQNIVDVYLLNEGAGTPDVAVAAQ